MPLAAKMDSEVLFLGPEAKTQYVLAYIGLAE